MKTSIHPKYYDNALVTCACGNTFTIGSTQESIRVELCSNCHPFYTGEQRFLDTASRIEKFEKKQQVAKLYKTKVVKKQEEEKKKESAPRTLREMLQALR